MFNLNFLKQEKRDLQQANNEYIKKLEQLASDKDELDDLNERAEKLKIRIKRTREVNHLTERVNHIFSTYNRKEENAE